MGQGNEGSTAVERIAELATEGDLSIAVAESLTGGQLAAALSAGPGASGWFRGGVVAYHPEVKFQLLGVERGPVVTKACAEQMAAGVAELTHARIAVAVTGVGGPDPEESQPPGTVWLALWADGQATAELLHFEGEPPEVLEATIEHALETLVRVGTELAGSSAS
jgi:nicotinamide-nucleotide amidase